MSTHNICFCGEIIKISTLFGWGKKTYLELWEKLGILWEKWLRIPYCSISTQISIQVKIFNLLLPENTFCGYSLEINGPRYLFMEK